MDESSLSWVWPAYIIRKIGVLKWYANKVWLLVYGKCNLGLSGQHSRCGDKQPFNLRMKFVTEGGQRRERSALPRRRPRWEGKQRLYSERAQSIYFCICFCLSEERELEDVLGVLFFSFSWTKSEMRGIQSHQHHQQSPRFCFIAMLLTHHYITSSSYSFGVCVCVYNGGTNGEHAWYSSNLTHLPACSFP